MHAGSHDIGHFTVTPRKLSLKKMREEGRKKLLPQYMFITSEHSSLHSDIRETSTMLEPSSSFKQISFEILSSHNQSQCSQQGCTPIVIQLCLRPGIGLCEIFFYYTPFDITHYFSSNVGFTNIVIQSTRQVDVNGGWRRLVGDNAIRASFTM